MGVSGRFSYLKIICTLIHGAIARLFCLAFFFVTREKSLFFDPIKNCFCFGINLVVLNLKIGTLNYLNCDLPTQYLLSQIADFDVIS